MKYPLESQYQRLLFQTSFITIQLTALHCYNIFVYIVEQGHSKNVKNQVWVGISLETYPSFLKSRRCKVRIFKRNILDKKVWAFNYASRIRSICSYHKCNSSSCFLVLVSGLGNFMYLGIKRGELFLGKLLVFFFHLSSDIV